MPSQRKYQVRATIAINGRQYDIKHYSWSETGREARIKAVAYWGQLKGCTTVQIWDTDVVKVK